MTNTTLTELNLIRDDNIIVKNNKNNDSKMVKFKIQNNENEQLTILEMMEQQR